MSGEHDHDEYAEDVDVERRFDDVDSALDAAYTAIQNLTHVCRTLVGLVDPALRETLVPWLNKAEELMGAPHEDPT